MSSLMTPPRSLTPYRPPPRGFTPSTVQLSPRLQLLAQQQRGLYMQHADDQVKNGAYAPYGTAPDAQPTPAQTVGQRVQMGGPVGSHQLHAYVDSLSNQPLRPEQQVTAAMREINRPGWSQPGGAGYKLATDPQNFRPGSPLAQAAGQSQRFQAALHAPAPWVSPGPVAELLARYPTPGSATSPRPIGVQRPAVGMRPAVRMTPAPSVAGNPAAAGPGGLISAPGLLSVPPSASETFDPSVGAVGDFGPRPSPYLAGDLSLPVDPHLSTVFARRVGVPRRSVARPGVRVGGDGGMEELIAQRSRDPVWMARMKDWGPAAAESMRVDDERERSESSARLSHTTAQTRLADAQATEAERQTKMTPEERIYDDVVRTQGVQPAIAAVAAYRMNRPGGAPPSAGGTPAPVMPAVAAAQLNAFERNPFIGHDGKPLGSLADVARRLDDLGIDYRSPDAANVAALLNQHPDLLEQHRENLYQTQLTNPSARSNRSYWGGGPTVADIAEEAAGGLPVGNLPNSLLGRAWTQLANGYVFTSPQDEMDRLKRSNSLIEGILGTGRGVKPLPPAPPGMVQW